MASNNSSCEHQMCAVRAFNSLCAECGPPGRAYTTAPSPMDVPWVSLNPNQWIVGATLKRTVETFSAIGLGMDGVSADTDRNAPRFKTAADKLHKRSKAVKELINSGKYSAAQLHAKLSWYAWDQSGIVLTHAVDGPCAACEAFCPAEYAALKPKVGKRGRPAKAKRGGGVLSSLCMRYTYLYHMSGRRHVSCVVVHEYFFSLSNLLF